eukprot:Rhum_TRINITY_DN2743_c0_g1::Rhum_TRINITY_DN2743_c0_g1_i1::g.8011::m.8011
MQPSYALPARTPPRRSRTAASARQATVTFVLLWFCLALLYSVQERRATRRRGGAATFAAAVEPGVTVFADATLAEAGRGAGGGGGGGGGDGGEGATAGSSSWFAAKRSPLCSEEAAAKDAASQRQPDDGEAYVSFEPWNGGYNNRRMGLELAFVAALVLNRTLVLPPATNAVLTPGVTSFADFYDIEAMRRHVPVVRWADFEQGPGRLLARSAHAPPFDAACDALALCSAAHRRPKPRELCVRCALARQRARQVRWTFNKIIVAADGVGAVDAVAGTEDFEEYRRQREPVSLHDEAAEDHWLHFPQNGFGLFYQVFYFQSRQRRKAVWRAVRDGVRVREEWEALAGLAAASPALRGGFHAVHYRRGDFRGQFKSAFLDPETLASKYRRHMGLDGEGGGAAAGALPVYLATDEGNPAVLGSVRKAFGSVPVVLFADVAAEVPALRTLAPAFVGIVEALVCARGRTFTGTKLSTFSAYITRLRGYSKAARDVVDRQIYFTDTDYQPGEVLREEGVYSWNPHQNVTKMGDFRGVRPLWMREYPESWELD